MYIQSSFIHLDKIGKKIEKELWDKNILSWEEYQNYYEKDNLFFDSKASKLYESINAYNNKDIKFFTNGLPNNEYYRLALSFPEDVIFLDIETTGLSQYYDHITMVGWSIGEEYNYYVNGISDKEKFKNDMLKAKIIVTFNGSIFDIPFIKKEFPDINIPECHIDLRFFSKRAGLSGGQKKIEDEINFKRDKSLKDTDGYMATILWDMYKWGNKSSLEKLIAYNHSDIEGMKAILDYSIKEIYKNTILKKYFKIPYKFTSKKSKLKKQEIKKFVKNSKIPFDPKSTLKYNELSSKIDKNIKIVGIDLTGSEERLTGVCLMDNNNIKTMQIGTDKDMIDCILKFKPDLVSIDSPLSLPIGRISVFDDDPGRDEFGILRICERILKKRGVNAYPTLLPSMQKLTKRGIELADKLRKLGFPTIESYPGVVQDIIGLPRKQVSLELLKQGLGKFGLKGEFLKKDVSHDEIDAITSAIVGMFFLSGDYEGIGDLRENLMIIPDLKSNKKKKKVIGISGHIASGKTTIAHIIKKEGYKYIRYSQILENILKKEKQKVTRQNLQRLGNKLNKNQIELSKKLYEFIKDEDLVVIDGLRHPEDFAFFFEMYGFNFKHIFIESHRHIREKRYIKFKNSKYDFLKATNHKIEKNIPKLKQLSNKVLYNHIPIKALKNKVLRIIREY
ncbi:MAG: ribonuclease H-like domain-containing protein [Arcobacter sp.]|uniref:ribonuclease H-like domain-containing protein n=1 Tax=Arcobacter sp. TaxID=1872629 RepID=UPI003D074001